MNKFNKENLKNIKNIFENKTNMNLSCENKFQGPIKAVTILISILIFGLTMTAFTAGLFSSLSGDDLGFQTIYEGNGMVSVIVDNKSNKTLNFQPKLKLMRWSTSKEVKAINNKVIFDGTKIPARSKGTITIDLSEAYNIDMLEKPLIDDHYYFVLTNNYFAFGQDWMCSVTFAKSETTPIGSISEIKKDDKIISEITKDLQFYFEDITFDINERNTLDEKYIQAYSNLFKEFDGKIISSVSPLELILKEPKNIIFDESVSKDKQYLLVGQHHFNKDKNFKILATSDETALTISAMIPDKSSEEGGYLPIFYILTYEKSAVNIEQDYAFIYGNLINFADLDKYKVYDDEKYVCYEISSLIYSNLMEYAYNFISQDSNLRYDEQIEERIKNIYTYYKENFSTQFNYR